MVRSLESDGSIDFEVAVVDPATGQTVCGPFGTVFERISDETPDPIEASDEVEGSFPSATARYTANAQ